MDVIVELSSLPLPHTDTDVLTHLLSHAAEVRVYVHMEWAREWGLITGETRSNARREPTNSAVRLVIGSQETDVKAPSSHTEFPGAEQPPSLTGGAWIPRSRSADQCHGASEQHGNCLNNILYFIRRFSSVHFVSSTCCWCKLTIGFFFSCDYATWLALYQKKVNVTLMKTGIYVIFCSAVIR